MSKAVSFTVGSLTEDTRLGRMLTGGRLTATMRSKKTDEHVTLTLNSLIKDGQWKHVPFAEATHVFIKLGRGEYGSTTIATYYPKKQQFYFNTEVAAYKYVAMQLLIAAQTGINETEKFEIFEEERCGVCGLALTDPVSIGRGIGPTCLGKLTGSVHYKPSEHSTPKESAAVVMTVNQPLRDVLVAKERELGKSPEEAEAKVASLFTDKKGRTVPQTFEQLVALVS